MLVACRLAGLSALEGHYAGPNASAQFGPCCVRPSATDLSVFKAPRLHRRPALPPSGRRQARADARLLFRLVGELDAGRRWRDSVANDRRR
jgi:hypothetical protein